LQDEVILEVGLKTEWNQRRRTIESNHSGGGSSRRNGSFFPSWLADHIPSNPFICFHFFC